MRKSKLFAALCAMLALLFTAVSCSSDSGGEEGGNDTTLPAFTSFTIPNAGISKKDNTVTAIVKGKNFTSIPSSSFTVTCADKPSIASGAVVTVQDDSTLKITLNIPDTAGEYAVTLASGKVSKKGTFIVKDYSTYTAGRIVLADGTLADADSYKSIDKSNPPVAVVAGFSNDYGVALSVGLHTSSSSLKWASAKAAGYKAELTDIVCTPSAQGSVASTATFTGDTDGSDNWDVICSVDPEGSADAATYYPAFNWANTYGETYKDYLGSATDGWYMPSLAELCYVYRSWGKINSALRVINKLDSNYAQSSIEAENFWSSSQYSHSKYFTYAWKVDFYGTVSYSGKSEERFVLVVRPVDSNGEEVGAQTTLGANVGKIVLADGTLAAPSSYTKIEPSNPPVAVVAYEKNGKSYGVGLHTSSSLDWAPSGTTGYSTTFTDIVCTPSIDYVADTATFTGDTDGSDNWSVICSKIPDGSTDTATYYPAFNWVNTYGETYAGKLGSATDGWYMPSIAELCYVYRSRNTINATLAVINGLDSSYAQSSLGTSYFWSSSQSSLSCYNAWNVDFSNGGVYDYGKANVYSVLVVRAF